MRYRSGDRSYEPGEVIVHCDAFFKVLGLPHKDTRCNICFKKKDRLIKCGMCKNVSYCDNDCMLKDKVNGHDLECMSPGFRASMKFWAKEEKIKILRLYALLKSNQGLSQKLYIMHDGTNRCFDDLMSHDSELSLDLKTISICEDLVKCMQGEDKTVRVDHFIRLHGMLRTNAFAICEEGVLIGHGIYMQGSNFDHSCMPTANCSIVDTKLEVRAIVPIIRGELPLISYLDLGNFDDRTTRRALLMEQYMFDCNCQRCIYEEVVDFDYANFKVMHTKMEILMNTFSAHWTMSWKEVSLLHIRYWLNLQELLNENDEFIVRYLVNYCRLAKQFNADKEVAHLRKETLRRIGITFGEKCKLYQEFNNFNNH